MQTGELMKQWRSDSMKLGTQNIHVVKCRGEYETEEMLPMDDRSMADMDTMMIIPAVRPAVIPRRPRPSSPSCDTPPRLHKIELQPIPPRIIEQGEKGIAMAVAVSVLPTTALIQREVRYFLGLAGRLPRKITLSKARRKEIEANYCHVRAGEGEKIDIPYEAIEGDVECEIYVVG